MHVRGRYRSILLLLLAAVMALTCVPIAFAGPKSSGKTVRLQILAVNDFHGQLEPYSSTLGGAALLAGYLDAEDAEAKASNGVSWHFGVGDLIGASPPSSGLLQDEPTLEAFDAMRFSYSTVGNHEFDEGLQELLRLQYGGFSPVTGHSEPVHMQYLAANVVRDDTGETIFPPYAIKYARGIPVGIIGVVYAKTPGIVTASGVQGLTFLDEATTVNKYVAELKARGVETIVVLLHNGGSGNVSGGPITGEVVPVVEAMDDEVDVVLSGHSHNRYWGYIDGKLVTSAHSAGRAFADVDLVLDRKTGDVVSRKAEIVVVDRTKTSITPDPKVAKIVAAAAAQVAPVVSRIVGTAAVDLMRAQNAAGESALGDLIADAQRWKGGTQIALMNPGGIRADLIAGEITWGELFAIQPFGNYLVTMKMTGAQIEQVLEQQWAGQSSPRILQASGIAYTWSSVEATGNKIDPASITVNGVPLDPAAVYTVTANNFLADGGDGFLAFKSATDKVVGGSDLDALVDYVMQLPQPIGTPLGGRIHVLP